MQAMVSNVKVRHSFVAPTIHSDHIPMLFYGATYQRHYQQQHHANFCLCFQKTTVIIYTRPQEVTCHENVNACFKLLNKQTKKQSLQQ